MSRAHRLFTTALLVSLALHLLFLASVGSWWISPAEEIPFPIEASLVVPEPVAPPAAAKPPAPRPRPRAIPVPAPEAAAASAPVPPPPALAAPTETPPPAAPPVPTPAEMPAPPPEPAAPAAPALRPALPPALRELPARLDLKYRLQAGEGGFNVGQAITTWQVRDGRYSLVSILQASGLAALFVSGKVVQTSEGRVTPGGLQPEQYWLARNQRRQDTARFDWPQQRLVLGGSGAELPAASQDLLSFPFHLALTVDESVRELSLWVTNGRKLHDYLFRNLGRERLPLEEGEIEALHLQGSRVGEGTLDVWLAPSRHWLPVRIRTLDQKGKVLLLTLEE